MVRHRQGDAQARLSDLDRERLEQLLKDEA